MSTIIVTHDPSEEARAALVAGKLGALGYKVMQEAAGALALSPMSRRKLEKDIAGAACVLVLWSREASPGLLSVAARAKAAGKLALARLDEAAPPSRVGKGADLTNWLGRKDARGWKMLAASIAAKAAPLKAGVARKGVAPTKPAAVKVAAVEVSSAPKKSGGAWALALVAALLCAGGISYYFVAMPH